MPGSRAGRQPPAPTEGAGSEGNRQPFPHATTHPKEAAGMVCSCKSLTAPFQQSSDISKAHQLSRCSDAQAIAKQFRGCREAHPVVPESSRLLRQGACGGSSSGEKLRKQQTGRAEPKIVSRCPVLGAGSRLHCGWSPVLPLTCCVTKDMWLALPGLVSPFATWR